MDLVRRNGSRVVIRQVPVVLLLVTAIFSVPSLAFSLFHLLRGTDADGKMFSLFFGLFILWLFLEFVATRERIEIDLGAKVLRRSVNGVFRNREQVVDLSDITGIGLELKPGAKGRRHQYLYMYGAGEKYLLNSPAKLHLDHGKLGRLLSEVTHIPYQADAGGNQG